MLWPQYDTLHYMYCIRTIRYSTLTVLYQPCIPHSHMYIQGFNQGVIIQCTVLVDKQNLSLNMKYVEKKITKSV